MTFPQQQQQWPPQQGAPQQFAQPQAPAQQPPWPPQGQQQGFPPAQQPAAPQQWQGQAQPAEQPTDGDTSGFFGGGVFLSFKDAMWRGIPRGGLVTGKQMRNQTTPGGVVKVWDDGSPRKELLLTLQTSERNDADDDGVRQLPIAGDKVRALREALKQQGQRDVAIGSWVYVAWTGDKPTNKGNAQKLFSALYAPPGQPDPMGGQAPQVQQVVQQQAQPPAQQFAAPQGQPGPIASMPAQQQQGATPAAQPPAQAPQQPPGFNPFAAPGQGQQPAQQAPQQPAQQAPQQPAQFNPFAPTQ